MAISKLLSSIVIIKKHDVYLPIEDANWGILVGDIDVEDTSLSNASDFSQGNIFPEGDWFWDLSLLKLLLRVQVEDLYNNFIVSK